RWARPSGCPNTSVSTMSNTITAITIDRMAPRKTMQLVIQAKTGPIAVACFSTRTLDVEVSEPGGGVVAGEDVTSTRLGVSTVAVLFGPSLITLNFAHRKM